MPAYMTRSDTLVGDAPGAGAPDGCAIGASRKRRRRAPLAAQQIRIGSPSRLIAPRRSRNRATRTACLAPRCKATVLACPTASSWR
eukprot:scaffold2191_cov392-Prasinococcus_capsulatus_cf.AAC.7